MIKKSVPMEIIHMSEVLALNWVNDCLDRKAAFMLLRSLAAQMELLTGGGLRFDRGNDDISGDEQQQELDAEINDLIETIMCRDAENANEVEDMKEKIKARTWKALKTARDKAKADKAKAKAKPQAKPKARKKKNKPKKQGDG